MQTSFDRTYEIAKNEDPRLVATLMADLIAENSKLRTRLNEIEKRQFEEQQEKFNIEERVKLLRQKMFGRSKEDRLDASDRPRDKSQEVALLFSQAAFPTPEKRGTKNTEELEDRVIEHHVTNEELLEESRLRGIENPSSDQWEGTSFFDQSIKIQIIERSYIKEIHKKFKKKLKPEFNKDLDKEIFITAKGSDELLAGMNYTTEFVASVVADKFISHLPLERQTRVMESLGLKGMQTSTLSRMCGLAAASLEPIQELILNELKISDLALNLDETPWKIQKKEEKDGYMWVVSNRYGSYYAFRPTRSGQVIKEILKDYTGPVVTDGYSGYNALDEAKVKQAFCWAHGRREFVQLEDHDPTVKPILDKIDRLFEIEREAKDFESLKDLREKKSNIVIDELEKLLLIEYPQSRPGSQKRKAIEYLLKRWSGFKVFLSDTRVPLSNNEAERTIRHAVVGRKNYYGSGNHIGAESAATLFTIVESCKKNDIDPRSYLFMALSQIAHNESPLTPLAYAKSIRQ